MAWFRLLCEESSWAAACAGSVRRGMLEGRRFGIGVGRGEGILDEMELFCSSPRPHLEVERIKVLT